MFWGCVVTEGKPYELPADSEYELLHVSNAALSKSSEAGKTYFHVTKDKETYTLGCLQKDKVETVFLDIFLRASQGAKFTVSGKGEVHLTGYFEATEGGEDLDERMIGRLMQGEEGEEEEEESEDVEEKPAKKEKPKEIKKEQKKEAKKEQKKEEKKPQPPAKHEQIGGKRKEEEESEESESVDEEGMEEVDLLGSEDEDEDELRQIVAEKKHPAQKPLVAPKPEKKMKEEKRGPMPGQGKKKEGGKKKGGQ